MTGLVGWWPLHEASGRANDLSGNGNHGTVNGATRNVFGRGGLTAYSFDGADDFIDTGTDAGLTSPPWTISAWVRSEVESENRYIVSKQEVNTDGYAVLRFSGAGKIDTLFHDDSGNTVSVDGNNTVSSGTWYHATAVLTEDTLELFIDGESQGVSDASAVGTFSNSSNVQISGYDGSYAVLQGSACGVRIYSRALSPQEVQTLYEQGSGDHTRPSLHDGSDSNAVSRWKFESGSVTTDSWGGNDLTDNTSAGTTSDAVYGTAKSFDGSDDYMEVPDLGLGSASDFTLSGWVNPDSDSDNNCFFGRYDGTDDILRYYYAADVDKVGIRMGHAAGNEIIHESTGTVSSGVWTHVTMVFDSTGPTATHYINGVKDSSSTATIDDFATTSGPDFGRSGNGTLWYPGDIDDFRLYSRALEPHEVAQLYRQGHGRDLRPKVVQK